MIETKLKWKVTGFGKLKFCQLLDHYGDIIASISFYRMEVTDGYNDYYTFYGYSGEIVGILRMDENEIINLKGGIK